VTFLPPSGPPATDVPRWTADSKAARLTIPYLGPQPPPSRSTSVALIAACAAAAAVQLVKAGLYLRQAQAEQLFLDLPSLAHAQAVRSGHSQLTTFGTISLLVIGLVLILDLVWRSQRRPKRRRVQHGEAYVEFPVVWVTPIAVRIGWVALALGSYFASAAGRTTATMARADFPHARQMSALSSVGWSLFFFTLIGWVLLINRSHDRRVAWSTPYRADPSLVPFFPPVAGMGLFGAGSSSGDSSRSTASGPMWALTTAGLILLCIFGVGALFGGVAELGYGHATGVAWIVAGGGSLAFVGWVMVRRYQQGKL